MKRTCLILALVVATISFGDVTTTTNRVDFDGDDSTVAFSFSFPLPEGPSDLEVRVRTIATGVEVLQVLTTDYSVSATNNDYSTGGTVTMVVAPAATESLTILRASAETQQSVFSDSGVLRLSALEAAYDKLTMIAQDHTEKLARAILGKPTDSTALTYGAVNSFSRASSYLFWGDDGSLTNVAAVVTSGTPVSGFGATLIDDADAAAARVTLGFLANSFWNALIADANSTEAQSTLGLLDEDDLSSDDAAHPASQQSIKAYIDGSVLSTTVTLTSANIKALAGTPIELVAAQGADSLIEFVSASLILEYGSEVFAEPSAPDDLAIEYDDGTGQQIATWDTTGFITNNADAIEIVNAAGVGAGASAVTAAANINKNIALLNTGGDYTGNASGDTTIKVYVTYRVHTSLGL